MGLLIKTRQNQTVPFMRKKVYNAVMAAMVEVCEVDESKADQISREIEYFTEDWNASGEIPSVEDIQDEVGNLLMQLDIPEVARAYERYRYIKEIERGNSKTYDSILSLVEMTNQEIKDENSNKNAIVASTQRDYMAGEISKDLANRILLPRVVVEAHKAGEIHFHDSDYFAQHIMNCCLVNLKDMLQNGTVINKTLIEPPKTLLTGTNISTQIAAIVASGQYGGQSMSLAHLAPLVNASRKRIREEVLDELYGELGYDGDESVVDAIVNKRLHNEIKHSVQTLQYQINTLNTSNGQTPFITIFMYLGEAENEQEREDLALLIEEVLRQRYEGVKNEKGVWITPAFPKLIYVLEEDNIHENSKYWYLTELAAKCTARRMVPDYISEKIMKQLKDGNCYPVMGCRSALTVWHDEDGKPKFYGRLANE